MTAATEFRPPTVDEIRQWVSDGEPEHAVTSSIGVEDPGRIPLDIGDGGQMVELADVGRQRQPLVPPRVLVPTVEQLAKLADGLPPELEAERAGAHRNPSGLSDRHAAVVRDMTVEAAWLGLGHARELHYTEGPLRWSWHTPTLHLAWKGQYPRFADCSAFATWCLFNGLHHYRAHDHVNGANWLAGFTGTMVNHGARVHGPLHRGDLVLYGNPFGATGHVAVYIGGGFVISFGSEPGPFKLIVHYRPDVLGFWRFI